MHHHEIRRSDERRDLAPRKAQAYSGNQPGDHVVWGDPSHPSAPESRGGFGRSRRPGQHEAAEDKEK